MCLPWSHPPSPVADPGLTRRPPRRTLVSPAAPGLPWSHPPGPPPEVPPQGRVSNPPWSPAPLRVRKLVPRINLRCFGLASVPFRSVWSRLVGADLCVCPGLTRRPPWRTPVSPALVSPAAPGLPWSHPPRRVCPGLTRPGPPWRTLVSPAAPGLPWSSHPSWFPAADPGLTRPGLTRRAGSALVSPALVPRGGPWSHPPRRVCPTPGIDNPHRV